MLMYLHRWWYMFPHPGLSDSFIASRTQTIFNTTANCNLYQMRSFLPTSATLRSVSVFLKLNHRGKTWWPWRKMVKFCSRTWIWRFRLSRNYTHLTSHGPRNLWLILLRITRVIHDPRDREMNLVVAFKVTITNRRPRDLRSWAHIVEQIDFVCNYIQMTSW